MPNEKSIILSKYRLERAKEFLSSARKNLEIEEYKTANNRAYYSIFHAMRAVLALDEVDFKKHSGVISYFREHYVKTRIFGREVSDIITGASLIRSKSDYDDFYIAKKDEAAKQVENAEKVYKITKEYLHDIYRQNNFSTL